MLLVDPHKEQFLHLIKNFRPFLYRCDKGDDLGNIKHLDLLLLQNGGDGGGRFPQPTGSVDDSCPFLVFMDDVLHLDGDGWLLWCRLRS